MLCTVPQPLQRLTQLTEDQWGLVTRRQAERAGVAWSSFAQLVKDKRVERVEHGVYRIRGAGEPDHLALRAAWLQLDPEKLAWERLNDPDVAVISHASSAAMYGVGDLLADVHEFTLPGRRQTRRPDVRLHRGRVPSDRWIVLRGLPVLRAGWMIGDLLADHVEPSTVAEITAEVLDHVYDYPRVIAESVGPFAARFGLPRGDGVALLDHLLKLAEYRDRAEMVKMAREA
jgi:hypothetical protein